jgi:hypothetical protein
MELLPASTMVVDAREDDLAGVDGGDEPVL